jgi:hypothetical protein
VSDEATIPRDHYSCAFKPRLRAGHAEIFNPDPAFINATGPVSESHSLLKNNLLKGRWQQIIRKNRSLEWIFPTACLLNCHQSATGFQP